MSAKLAVSITAVALLAMAASQPANAQAAAETAPAPVIWPMNVPHAPTVAPPVVAVTTPPVASAMQAPSSTPTFQLIRR